MRSKPLRALKFGAFFCASALIRLLCAAPPSSSGTLLLRLDRLGDFIVWLGSGAREVANYARSRGPCIALVDSQWAELALRLDLFDEVWPLEVKRFLKNPLYRIAILLRLRKRGFDVVIQPRSSRSFLLEDLIVWTTQAPESIGNAGDDANTGAWLKRLSDRWYTRQIPLPSGEPQERRRNIAFARGLSGKAPTAVEFEFDPDVGERLRLPENFFVVAPGAGAEGRIWPAARFTEIAARLHTHRGWLCVLVGTAQERVLAAPIKAALGENCRDFMGKLCLEDVGAVLERARLVIGNESSAAHFAAHVGTTAIVVLGGGHFGRFLPRDDSSGSAPRPVYKPMDCFGCNWQCRYSVPKASPKPCIDRIGVEDVWHAVTEHI
jgi:ADP-heptose:LPS heptosyltransferase